MGARCVNSYYIYPKENPITESSITMWIRLLTMKLMGYEDMPDEMKGLVEGALQDSTPKRGEE